MKFFEILLEGREDEFRKKYANKFSLEQLDRIVAMVTPKYLDWVGKNLDAIGFVETFPKLTQALTTFNKISSNLPYTDINQYKSISQLIEEIEKYQKKPRREYTKVQGGNVVYDDGKYFVVNPQTHDASCYYGKGTKWCTAANTDYHFNRYNDDGKLFYILDRTKPTSDPTYKIAILQKFDGDMTLYDAEDKSRSEGTIFTPQDFAKINKAINEYLENEYSEQLKIFRDREAAQKERERLEKIRKQRILQGKRNEAQSRREDNEWALNEDCPDEGIKAHALLDWLETQNDVEVKTPEDSARIDFIRAEIERLQNEYDNNEDVRTDILDEISDLEDELEALENRVDVYNIIPDGQHYDTTAFIVIDADLDGRRYAVGTEDEMRESCRESVKSLIDDVGYQGFNRSFVMNHIDQDAIENYARDIYDSDVRDNPEVYFDESDRELSDEQESKLEVLRNRISNIEENISDMESELDEVNSDEEREEMEEKIEELKDMISDMESEIEDIESSPDGDFPEDMIDEKVEDLVSDATRYAESFISDFGLEWENFIDEDEFIDAVIDEDGYGHTLNGYDGNADEVKIMDEWYYVMRID